MPAHSLFAAIRALVQKDAPDDGRHYNIFLTERGE